MVNKEQTQEPSIVADPGLDPMSALRQTTQQAQSVTNGTVSTPAIEETKGAIASNQQAQAALPPMKYSRDGIPEGLDHVTEMERLRAMIQGNTASANDIDNYITLQVRAATQFQREGEAAAVDNILGGADGAGADATGATARETAGKVQPAQGARAAVRAHPSGGAGGQSHSVRMGGGSPSSAPARGDSGTRGGVGGAKQAVDPPAPEEPAVKSKTNGGITTGPVNPWLRPGRFATGPVNPNKSRTAAAPTQEELIRKNDAEKVGLSEAKGLVRSVFAPMGSGGNGLDEAPRNTPRAMSGITTGPTNPQAPRPTSGPSRVAQLPPEQRGKYSPDMPSSKAAAYEAMAEMIPGSIIPVATAGAALKGGLPRKMAEKVEAELMPGVMNAGRKLAGRMRPSMGEPTIPEGFGSQAAPNVRAGSSRVPSPEAKAAQLRAAERPTAAGVRQTIQAAEPAPSPRPKPAKSATAAATSASEYLEKRDSGALPKVPQGSLAQKAPSREPMRSQGSSSSSRQSSGGAGRLNDQGGKKTGVGSLNKPKRPEAPAPSKPRSSGGKRGPLNPAKEPGKKPTKPKK